MIEYQIHLNVGEEAFLSQQRTRLSESLAQWGADGGQLCLRPCPPAGRTLPLDPLSLWQHLSGFKYFSFVFFLCFVSFLPFLLHPFMSQSSGSVGCFFFYFTSISFPFWFLSFLPFPPRSFSPLLPPLLLSVRLRFSLYLCYVPTYNVMEEKE